MSFIEDTWEEMEDDGELLDGSSGLYDHQRSKRRTARRVHSEIFSDLPTWTEDTSKNLPIAHRYESADFMTIGAYLATSLILSGFSIEKILSPDKSWALLTLILALMSIFLAVGRIIEVKARGGLA